MAETLTMEQRLEKVEKENDQQKKKIKKLEKQMKQLMKLMHLDEVDEAKPKKESGFAKPQNISVEMCKFLDVEEGTMLSRNEVSKRIIKYIKDNELQKPENRRLIIVDKKLETILKVPDDIQLSFFNLQRYLSPHYPKNERPKTAPVQETKKVEEPKKVVKKIVRKKVMA